MEICGVIMQRIRTKYTKGPEIKYVSHLDLIRAIERAVRRAGIPIAYSQGFNPKPQISFGPPTSVGMESIAELADFHMDYQIGTDIFEETMNKALPPGIKILETYNVLLNKPSITAEIKQASYLVELSAQSDSAAGLSEQTKKILAAKEIMVDKKSKTGIRAINIRPMIYELIERDGSLYMTLAANPSATLRPDMVVGLIKGYEMRRLIREKLV